MTAPPPYQPVTLTVKLRIDYAFAQSVTDAHEGLMGIGRLQDALGLAQTCDLLGASIEETGERTEKRRGL